MKFYIVDAFSDKAFGGNTAGVVLIEKDKKFPDDSIMLSVAKELRYSETVFVKRVDEKVFELRFFTPESEVDLCGHATIAAFSVLLKEDFIDEGNYVSRTKAGDLSIEAKSDFILMEMGKPEIIKKFDEEKDIDEIREIYDCFGLDFDEVKNPYFSIMPYIASAGLKEIFLNVFNLDALNALNPDFEKIKEVSEKHGCIGIHAYTLMAPDMKVHARNFAPSVGTNEESATGTSNGALGFILLSIDMALPLTMFDIVQGEKLGKPSVIKVINLKNGEDPIVKVGGNSFITASGELHI